MSTKLSELLSATIETSTSSRTLGELLGLKSSASAKPSRARSNEPLAFPLQRVVVSTRIVGDCAHTTLEEHYTNPHKQPMDVTHTIPLPHTAAVVAFEITAGTHTAKGLCKPTADAKKDFANALARGKTAAMVESVRDDVHTISLGNVPAKTSIIVRMELVERLSSRDGALEYRFPTAISPKFVPGNAQGHSGEGTSPDTDQAPDASHLTPPVRLEGGTQLQFSMRLPLDRCSIKSSVPITLTRDETETLVTLQSNATCDGDIVLRLDARAVESTVRAYSDGERTLVVVDPPLTRGKSLERKLVASFVLDRSSSMRGDRVQSAKRAIREALGALRETDAFELSAFCTSISNYRNSATLASKENVCDALLWLDSIQADGGTLALPALEASCTTPVAEGWVRTVLFVTDGDVGNDGELLALTNRIDPATRVFVVGIGMAPSHALLSRLARLGGGSYLALGEDDDIEAEMTRFNHEFTGPIAFELREQGSAESMRCDLFNGRSTSFFIPAHRDAVTIESADGHFHGDCVVERAPFNLGALWARFMVEKLEDQIIAKPRERESLESTICKLGVDHQIQTRFTGFVAVDENSNVNGEPIAVVQPTDSIDDCDMGCEIAPVSRGCQEAVQITGKVQRLLDLRSSSLCLNFSRPRLLAPVPAHRKMGASQSLVERVKASSSESASPFTAAPTGRRALDWSTAMTPAPSIPHAIQILYWGFSASESRQSPLWLQLFAILRAASIDKANSKVQLRSLTDLCDALDGTSYKHDMKTAFTRANKRFPLA
ncbi:MAG: VWA domain-containing protein [Phycisphaerales bacterium]|nr:VWA domain-containing protein [Phycisphaerales bacterium]